MTHSLTDQYHFEQPSPAAAPGFLLFKGENAPFWFFHANDTEGIPLLFSQRYTNQDSARKGLRATLDSRKKHRISILAADGTYSLSVRAANHQEIARSRSFGEHTACEAAQNYLVQVAHAKHPEGKPAASEVVKAT